jgi:hypothetical protein
MTMTSSFEDFVSIIQSVLTPQERADGVAYAMEAPVAAGTHLQFPGVVIEAPAGSRLAFVDRQPTANWGHSARYVLVSVEGGEVRSFEARLPPFQSGGDLQWRVIYKAQSAPDAAVALPQQPKPRH